MLPEQFKQLLSEKGLQLTAEQMQQYEMYYTMLVDWNNRMNLTAITDQEAVYLKHFYDSLTLALETDLMTDNRTLHLCDVGAGAGFPSIPLKIAFPQLHITIVDSLQKRINFLNHLVDKLGLEHVSCYHDRAETFGQNVAFRESFDIVTARAVARLNLLSEFCLPLVSLDGYFVAMKASSTTEEIEEAKGAIKQLGGALVNDKVFELPFDGGARHIVTIKKEKSTPKKYPRKPGIPAKNPMK